MQNEILTCDRLRKTMRVFLIGISMIFSPKKVISSPYITILISSYITILISSETLQIYCQYKIHLWRHSIVLALHYFQGMACYRSAALLEAMDTRSLWNMFAFSRVIYRRSCISEAHSNNSCFSMNKKSRWWQLVSNPRRLRCGLSFESSALPTELSQRWRRGSYFIFIKYISTRERGYIWYIICIDTWTL